MRSVTELVRAKIEEQSGGPRRLHGDRCVVPGMDVATKRGRPEVEDVKHIETDCSICLETGPDSAETVCGHRFHRECLAEWTRTNDTCPLCNATIVVQSPTPSKYRVSFTTSVDNGTIRIYFNVYYGERRHAETVKLPYTQEGRQVSIMIVKAAKRDLLFRPFRGEPHITIGTELPLFITRSQLRAWGIRP